MDIDFIWFAANKVEAMNKNESEFRGKRQTRLNLVVASFRILKTSIGEYYSFSQQNNNISSV